MDDNNNEETINRRRSPDDEEEDIWDLPKTYESTVQGLGEAAEPGDEFEDLVEDPEEWKMEDLLEDWAGEVPNPDFGGPFVVRSGWDPDGDTDEEIEDFEINYRYRDYGDMDKVSLERRAPSKWKRIDEEDVPPFPYYKPYRKHYPPFYEYDLELSFPEGVIEQLDKNEFYQQWYSYVFPDGTTYEGTVFNDMAVGKGVYTNLSELFRYEGEWQQNMMQGHGVLDVDVPDLEPVPDSAEAKTLKALGCILKTDYLPREERQWLKKDIADVINTKARIPFFKRKDIREWISKYDTIPEPGHYRYAGQWKHSRMHGCGVLEAHGQMKWGRFYFGEYMDDPLQCTAEISALHAGLAEAAAAKARMFVNKPDGMVRELKGPFSDPQHPFMYDPEDLWMAPGWINQFYEVPALWERYVHDVDQERQMWLNSFYRSPLRLPMTPELEHWWSKDPNFVRLGSVHDEDDEDDDNELLVHLPTGRLINWVEDDEGHVRLFYQPVPKIPVDENGNVMPEEENEKEDGEELKDVQFLPLGFDKFLDEFKEEDENDYHREMAEEENKLNRGIEERLNASKEEREVLELETEYEAAEGELDNVLKNLVVALQEKQRLEELKEQKAQSSLSRDDIGVDEAEQLPEETSPEIIVQTEDEKKQDIQDEEPRSFGVAASDKAEENGEEEEPKSLGAATFDEEGEEDEAPRSFGTIAFGKPEEFSKHRLTKRDQNGKASSLSSPTVFASLTMVSQVAFSQINSFRGWVKGIKCLPSMASHPLKTQPNVRLQLQKSNLKLSISPQNTRNINPTHARLKTKGMLDNRKYNSKVLRSNRRNMQFGHHTMSHSSYGKPKRDLKISQYYHHRNLQQQRTEHFPLMSTDVFHLAIPVPVG